MEKFIGLLKQKNEYLEKFFDLNRAEMENFAQARFESLESFYKTREDILEKVRLADEQIEQFETSPDVTEPTREDRLFIQDLVSIKEELVKEILAQDLQILSSIEKAKSEIIRELQSVNHNRKAVGAYKSRRVIPLLDEEL